MYQTNEQVAFALNQLYDGKCSEQRCENDLREELSNGRQQLVQKVKRLKDRPTSPTRPAHF